MRYVTFHSIIVSDSHLPIRDGPFSIHTIHRLMSSLLFIRGIFTIIKRVCYCFMLIVNVSHFVVSMPCSVELLSFLAIKLSFKVMIFIEAKFLVFTKFLQQVFSLRH